jgi:hypothetical protein
MTNEAPTNGDLTALVGAVLNQATLDSYSVFEFDAHGGDAELSFQLDCATVSVDSDDPLPLNKEQLKLLVGATVSDATAESDGSIVLKLNAVTFRVQPARMVESWELRAPGLFAVGPPGGGSAAVWDCAPDVPV